METPFPCQLLLEEQREAFKAASEAEIQEWQEGMDEMDTWGGT